MLKAIPSIAELLKGGDAEVAIDVVADTQLSASKSVRISVDGFRYPSACSIKARKASSKLSKALPLL